MVDYMKSQGQEVFMSTTLDDYQIATRDTAMYPAIGGKGYIYPLIGLTGEVGELSNKIKKIFRDDAGELTDERRVAIKSELGDVLWYLARTADELGFTLSDIGDSNIAHLQERKQRNAIHGSGDIGNHQESMRNVQPELASVTE